MEPWCSWPARIRFSRTVSCGKTCSSWNVRLTPRRLSSDGRRPVTSRPSTRTSPAVGSSWPRMQLNSVDLPEPLGPMIPRISPSSHVERHVVDGAHAAEILAPMSRTSSTAFMAPPPPERQRLASAARRPRTAARPGRRSRSGRRPSARSRRRHRSAGNSLRRNAAIPAAARRSAAPTNGPRKEPAPPTTTMRRKRSEGPSANGAGSMNSTSGA